MSDLGKKIRKVREIKGLTQEFLAKQLKISQKAYSNLENGETKISWERVMQIAEILEIEPVDLVGFDETKIFNNCTQSGNEHQTINYHISEPLEKAYLDQIEHLKKEVNYFRDQFNEL